MVERCLNIGGCGITRTGVLLKPLYIDIRNTGRGSCEYSRRHYSFLPSTIDVEIHCLGHEQKRIPVIHFCLTGNMEEKIDGVKNIWVLILIALRKD